MNHASFFPPCRSFSAGGGGTRLVSTADVLPIRGVSVLRQRIRLVDCVPSRGYDTPDTTAEDASAHPDSPRPALSTHGDSAGNGRPHSPHDRTAHTRDWRTGTPYGCAANVSCRQHHRARRDPCSLAAGAWRSGPLPSTRGIRVSGRGYGAYAAWGSSGGMTGGLIGEPSGIRGVISTTTSRPGSAGFRIR